MNNHDYNTPENTMGNASWNTNDYSEHARNYIRESRERNEEPSQEGWFNRVKENVTDAWEDTKDAASDAWEKTKNWADNAWEDTKDGAEDVKSEVRKATN